ARPKERSSLVLHSETLESATGGQLLYLYPLDACPRRGATAPGHDLTHLLGRTFHHRLHRSICAVADPTGQSETNGLQPGAVPEENALDPALDSQRRLKIRHQDTFTPPERAEKTAARR